MQLHLFRLERDERRGLSIQRDLTPLRVEEEKIKRLEKLAIETAELFELRRSVGVDFILADGAYVLELNPRFLFR